MSHIKIKIVHDDSPNSPREWDNVGVMACWHKRYSLGDIEPKESPEEWLRANAPKGSIVLPLYLYDHGGITMRTSAFSSSWDSGQVGWIVATPETIRKNWLCKRITKDIREKVEKCLMSEVQTYADYLEGNVWGYTVTKSKPPCERCSHVDTEITDSCWGFFGDDVEGIKANFEPALHALVEQAWGART